MDTDDFEVHHDPAAQRFESEVEGSRAWLDYERDGPRVVYLHTRVPTKLEGRGIGSALAHAALEAAQVQGWRVVPRCAFVRSYLDRHPAYHALVDPILEEPSSEFTAHQ
jgi:predicted GNAT family acetyltransferase